MWGHDEVAVPKLVYFLLWKRNSDNIEWTKLILQKAEPL